jgi:hypothetical protein
MLNVVVEIEYVQVVVGGVGAVGEPDDDDLEQAAAPIARANARLNSLRTTASAFERSGQAGFAQAELSL